MTEILLECLSIENTNFLYAPYKELPIVDWYKSDGIANKGTEICHYCTIDTLQKILKNQCLRFSDVRFLNDSTEFMEAVHLIKAVIDTENYSTDFKKFIIESETYNELNDYKQSYVEFSQNSKENKIYRTYTCSFSTHCDLLNMWNYYSESSGVNLTYDYAWNMFEGSEESEIKIINELDNGIIISRGVVLYDYEPKRKCVKALLDRLYTVYEKAKNQTTDYSKQILQAFKKSVNHMRCFFKNEHYVDEREYRFVLRIPEELILGEKETGNIKEIGFFKRGKVQIPYVDYKVKRDGLERIIINPYVKKEYDMVVSPKNNENDMVVSKENNERIDIIKTSIEEMLWMYKYEGVEVVHSNIPARKYD